MGNDPQRTLGIAEVLTGHGLHVFGLTSQGLPHKLCDACSDPANRNREHLAECSCLLCHGFYSATDDMERVREIVKAKPYTLLGVRTGLPSGVLVVDFDNHPGGANGLPFFDQWRDEGKLTPTVKIRTGGGGIHLYYSTGSDWPTRPGFVPGVDIKSSGGYVVAPGFKKLGRPAYVPFDGRGIGDVPFAAVPDWMVSELAASRASAAAPRPVTGPRANSGAQGRDVLLKRLGSAVARLREAPEGQRNQLLFAVACRAGEAWSGSAIDSEEGIYGSTFMLAQSMGLDSAEIVKTWQSGFRRGMQDFSIKGARVS